jgi:hypothetical protein
MRAESIYALDAEPQDCFGSLRVVVFERVDAGGGDSSVINYGDRPVAPPSRTPLDGVRVTVTGAGFGNTQITNARGTAFWAALAAGDYDVIVDAPAGYTQPNNRSVTIHEAEEELVEVDIAPEPATVRVRAFFDANHSGVWIEQPPIRNVPIDFYRHDTQIACLDTGPDGVVEQQILRPGLITIAPRSPIRVGGRVMRAAQRAQLLVQADAGQECEVAIPYALSPAELQLSACIDRVVNGEHEIVPFPGVTFSLYEGLSANGVPLRQATTRGTQPAVFTDLEDGDYTIVPSEPSTHRGRLELVEPRNAALRINLCAGQTIRLREQFCYRLCVGRVAGRVLDSECGNGLGSVPILLLHANGHEVVERTQTGPNGDYSFEDVAPGNYIVSLEQTHLMMPDGTPWVVSAPQEAEYSITVSGSGMTIGPTFRLMPDIHRIWGYVRGPDQQALPNSEVAIRDAHGHQIITVVADTEGRYEWIAPVAGTYYVAPLRTPDGSLAQAFPVRVNQPVQQDIIVAARGFLPPAAPVAAAGINGGGGGLGEVAGDIAAYPILTEDVGQPSSLRTSTSGAAGAAPLGQLVENTLRDVLAWRPKATDPKGFLAALNQSFTCEDTEGRTICKWTPRSYAVQADMGAITGAQASIFTRAKAALDQMIPLLEGLRPLRADADIQDVEASRSIVRSHLTELVNELGAQGGPRVSRVDTLFNTLLGPNDALPNDIAQLQQGQLRQLRDLFGFERGRVNTVEEEQNLTNFIIIVDHTRDLRQSWINQRAFFDRRSGVEPFFGTQMVLLSRSLAVVSESVHEAAFAMDSVFLDSAERQTTELLYATQPPIFIEELLTWADRFASEEAPRLIQDGGKFGVISFQPTLEQLRVLVRGALLQGRGGEQDPARLPAGYRTTRVQRALEELADHLDEADRLADQIRRDLGRPNGFANR